MGMGDEEKGGLEGENMGDTIRVLTSGWVDEMQTMRMGMKWDR